MLRSWRPVRRKVRALFRRDAPEYASSISLAACIVLAAGSLAIGLLQHSLLLQTNGYISLIDIGASVLFLAAVARSTRSADMAFNYGYGKYESLAILVSATLLVVLGVATIIEAGGSLLEPPGDRNVPLLLGWSVLTFGVMRATAQLLERYANRFHMPMLRYDAELWRVDSWVEVGVIVSVAASGIVQTIGLLGASALIDGLSSVLLVAVTLKVPIQHGTDAFRQLLDRTLPEEMQYEILAIIAGNYNSMCEFRTVHTRQSGKDIFIEIDMVMPFDFTLDQLYDTERGILAAIRERFPTAIPRIYVTPCDRSCLHADLTATCPLRPIVLDPKAG